MKKDSLGRRGVVTFVFDDGYDKVHTNVVPLLNRLHLPGVFAVTLNNTGMVVETGQPIYNWQRWLNVREDGHEIAAHSVSHSDLTTLPPDDLELELDVPKRALRASTFVYPGGAVNAEVLERTRHYYTAARGLSRGFESLPPKEPMNLKSFDFTRANFSVAKANLLALWAYVTNSWLIETYHLVDDDEKQLRHTVKTAAFARHLDFVARLPVTVQTISETINQKYDE